jgi:hypothetical protein
VPVGAGVTDAGSVNLLGTTPYLSRKPIRVFGPERADLEAILGALHTEFVLRDSGERYRHVVEAWAAVAPDAGGRDERGGGGGVVE